MNNIFDLLKWMNGKPAIDRDGNIYRYVGSLRNRDTIYLHIGESDTGSISMYDAIGGNLTCNPARSLIRLI